MGSGGQGRVWGCEWGGGTHVHLPWQLQRHNSGGSECPGCGGVRRQQPCSVPHRSGCSACCVAGVWRRGHPVGAVVWLGARQGGRPGGGGSCGTCNHVLSISPQHNLQRVRARCSRTHLAGRPGVPQSRSRLQPPGGPAEDAAGRDALGGPGSVLTGEQASLVQGAQGAWVHAALWGQWGSPTMQVVVGARGRTRYRRGAPPRSLSLSVARCLSHTVERKLLRVMAGSRAAPQP